MTLPIPGAPERRRGVVGPFTARHLATALVVVLVATIALVVATRPIVGPAPTAAPVDPRATQYLIGTPGEGLHVGDRAPEVTITGPEGSPAPLLDLDGRPLSLAALRGHPVWINFWATWCPPCQSETPTIRDLAKAYAPRGLVVVGISVQEATEDDVRAYAVRYGLGYTIAADLAGDVFRRYRVYGLPTQYFLDGDGVIRSIVQGPITPEIVASALAAAGITAGGGASPTATPGTSLAATPGASHARTPGSSPASSP